MIPVSFLRECFEYRADGMLVWRTRPLEHFPCLRHQRMCNARWAGKTITALNHYGYHTASVSYGGKQRKLLAHRVAWALHTGAWPTQFIDHINHVRHDNRLCNLRDVSHQVNMYNRKGGVKRQGTGLTGAYPSKSGRSFRSQIHRAGRIQYLGTFATAEQANAAFMAAAAARSAA